MDLPQDYGISAWWLAHPCRHTYGKEGCYRDMRKKHDKNGGDMGLNTGIEISSTKISRRIPLAMRNSCVKDSQVGMKIEGVNCVNTPENRKGSPVLLHT